MRLYFRKYKFLERFNIIKAKLRIILFPKFLDLKTLNLMSGENNCRIKMFCQNKNPNYPML